MRFLLFAVALLPLLTMTSCASAEKSDAPVAAAAVDEAARAPELRYYVIADT